MSVTMGIVGTGVGIRTHLAGALDVEGVEVVGVVGRDVARSRELLLAQGFNPDLAMSWPALLSASPELVCLTTPLSDRHEYLDGLREVAKFVLFEKPVVGSGESGDRLQEQLGSVANRSFVDFQLRGLTAISRVHAAAKGGIYGDVYSVSLFERTSALRKSRIAPWMRSPSSGGGQRFAMGSHLVDLGIFVSGYAYENVDVENVQGTTKAPRRSWAGNTGRDDSDEFFGCVFQAGSCRIDITTTCVSPGTRTLEFRVEGSEGAAEFRYRAGVGELREWTQDGERVLYVSETGDLLEEKPRTSLDPSAFRVAYPKYLMEVRDAVLGGDAKNLASLADGVKNAEILERHRYEQ